MAFIIYHIQRQNNDLNNKFMAMLPATPSLILRYNRYTVYGDTFTLSRLPSETTEVQNVNIDTE